MPTYRAHSALSARAQRAGLAAGSEPKFRSALKARGFVGKREAGTRGSGYLGLRLRAPNPSY